MLRELVEKKHTVFADKAKDWRDAIKLSCAPFAVDGTAEEGYADEVIRCIGRDQVVVCAVCSGWDSRRRLCR